MVVPTPFVAATLKPVADKFRPDGILVSCTKGILNDTLETREHLTHMHSLYNMSLDDVQGTCVVVNADRTTWVVSPTGISVCARHTGDM
jgi:glycerol-3-phosphate dehydrogenase